MEKAPLSLKIDHTTINEADNYTLYVISVERGLTQFDSWKVQKRYNEFADLHKILKEICPALDLPLPGKKLFGSMEKSVVAERQSGFQMFLDLLQEVPIALWQPEVLKFLNADDTVGATFKEGFERDLLMALRGLPEYSLVSMLPRIGSRYAKGFAAVASGKATHILSLTLRDPECSVSDDNLKAFFATSLEGIQHSFLLPVLSSEFVKDKGTALVVRPQVLKGSLKDHIYDKQPKGYFSAKYVNKKPGYGFKEPAIRLYGRQILEAVKFLQSIGMIVTHLHTGNIFLDDQTCKLSDIENAILGVPCLYHTQLVAFGKCTTPEEATVLLFGMVLYEMFTGKEYLPTATSKPTFPADTPSDLQKVIEMLVTPSGKFPTIAELLDFPYFSQIKLPDAPKGSHKKTAKLLETWDSAKKDWVTQMEHSKKLGSSPPTSPRLGTSPGIPRKAGIKKTPSVGQRSSKLLSASTSATASTSAAPPATQASPVLSAPPPGKTSPAPSGKTSPAPSQAPQKAPQNPQPSKPPTTPSTPAPPPPPPAAPAPPPPPPATSTPPPDRSGGRGALLSSIEGFKGGLKKVKTRDGSKPKIK